MTKAFPGNNIVSLLHLYRQQMIEELRAIMEYWILVTVDGKEGGFYGKIDHNNVIHRQADKGAVLNSRILWAFSAANNLERNIDISIMADRAYQYLADHFIDKEMGGLYWTVDHKGNPADTKKQTYATAFGIYALSEYYKNNPKEIVRTQAIDLYKSLLAHAYDSEYGGYLEAFARDWSEMPEIRLSAKDANEKKSMNTHLHVLEAFANLYSIWPDIDLKNKIGELLGIFHKYIIDPGTFHLLLFFEKDWKVKSSLISYGHDIEAAWLLLEAAEIIGHKEYTSLYRLVGPQMAKAASGGTDNNDGGLWYEYDPAADHWIRQKHSWPQAEAMIGFFNAWQITGDENMLQLSLNAWNFTTKFIKDPVLGEWVWGIHEDYSIMNEEDKVGVWKCPYHNSRACMEIIKRIDSVLK